MITNLATLLRSSINVLCKLKKNNPHTFNKSSINAVKFIMHDYYNNLDITYDELNNYIDKYNVNDYGYHKFVINNPINDMINLELNIITWLPYTETPLHGHDNKGCLMMPILGTLGEDIFYNKNNLLLPSNNINLTNLTTNTYKINKLLPGDISYIDDNIGEHIIINNSNYLAVSIHLCLS
jgi:hypothetical protein